MSCFENYCFEKTIDCSNFDILDNDYDYDSNEFLIEEEHYYIHYIIIGLVILSILILIIGSSIFILFKIRQCIKNKRIKNTVEEGTKMIKRSLPSVPSAPPESLVIPQISFQMNQPINPPFNPFFNNKNSIQNLNENKTKIIKRKLGFNKDLSSVTTIFKNIEIKSNQLFHNNILIGFIGLFISIEDHRNLYKLKKINDIYEIYKRDCLIFTIKEFKNSENLLIEIKEEEYVLTEDKKINNKTHNPFNYYFIKRFDKIIFSICNSKNCYFNDPYYNLQYSNKNKSSYRLLYKDEIIINNIQF